MTAAFCTTLSILIAHDAHLIMLRQQKNKAARNYNTFDTRDVSQMKHEQNASKMTTGLRESQTSRGSNYYRGYVCS